MFLSVYNIALEASSSKKFLNMVSNSGSLIGADVARASQGGDVVWNPSGRVTVAVVYRIPPGVSTTVRSVVTWDENEGGVASAWTRCQEASMFLPLTHGLLMVGVSGKKKLMADVLKEGLIPGVAGSYRVMRRVGDWCRDAEALVKVLVNGVSTCRTLSPDGCEVKVNRVHGLLCCTQVSWPTEWEMLAWRKVLTRTGL